MTYGVVIAKAAHQSIDHNTSWWAENHSYSEAVAWQNLIYEQIAELDTLPERHGFARENDNFPYDLRQKLVGKGNRPTYRVLFTIKGSVVHVLQFRAAEQDDWLG